MVNKKGSGAVVSRKKKILNISDVGDYTTRFSSIYNFINIDEYKISSKNSEYVKKEILSQFCFKNNVNILDLGRIYENISLSDLIDQIFLRMEINNESKYSDFIIKFIDFLNNVVSQNGEKYKYYYKQLTKYITERGLIFIISKFERQRRNAIGNPENRRKKALDTTLVNIQENEAGPSQVREATENFNSIVPIEGSGRKTKKISNKQLLKMINRLIMENYKE